MRGSDSGDNLIIPTRYDSATRAYGDFKDGRAVTKELLDRFKILDTIRGTRFCTQIETVGVIADVGNPLVNLGDYTEEYPDTLADLLYAGFIRHEYSHVEQAREDLPTNSLWAERCAMSAQCRFLQQILHSEIPSKTQEDFLVGYLRFTSEVIQNYRNGFGFEDHLIGSGSNTDGSPKKDQNLHIEDYRFGY